MANTIRAGRIRGNPLTGLCERICIEVQRVFDGCRENFNNQSFTLTVAQISAEATPPFTFVEASGSGEAAFENVVTVPLGNGRSRVSGDIVLPVTVTFTDAYNNAYTGVSSFRVHREFVLRLPEQSLVPYRIEVFAVFESLIGSFLSDDTVAGSGCYVYVAKVIVPTDILIPTYGNCVYPGCVDCGDACNALLSIPLFPIE